jgi:predicted ATPase/nitrogen-specific signal transduction histidine kinase
VTKLSGYVFSPLREGNCSLYRGLSNGLASVLLLAVEDGSPEDVQLLEHEFSLRADLDTMWAVKPLTLSHQNDRWELVLEDPGGEPLDRLLNGPLDVSEFMTIAIQLADVLQRVHERGLIHRDVKPANVLVDRATRGVKLTGFGIASRLREKPAAPEVISGTLAYMAPEQTGRMDRSTDVRSDLYSLGVTYYEMLTGVLPFAAQDPMEWVHCHIAKQPIAPDERISSVPQQLSSIVMKLLNKSPDERYQTAAGVESDLRRCHSEWESQRRIDPFPLGLYEISDRLKIPERLYGRESEVESLLACFHRVATTAKMELVLISGYSGIGKSSLVHELHKILAPTQKVFAEGKFDTRDMPYAPFAQAFQGLLRPLLGESDMELNPWREAFREALGSSGQLVVNLVPELELIIGRQPEAECLPPSDAPNRFRVLIQRFLHVFARKEHPLVLFLDDLQWLDPATLDLVEHLLTRSDLQYLLLIGAYRDNEINASHPLRRTIKSIRNSEARIHEIALPPLPLDDIGELVADTLRCEPERARPLAQLIHNKTGGNPLFAIEFLTSLVSEGLLTFERHVAAWTWNLTRARTKGYADNVVDFMIGKLRRLPPATQETLKHLAYLGHVADLSTLMLVTGEPDEKIHSALWDATRSGLILRKVGAYVFAHDRIQEAAYSLTPARNRAATHLRIGRLLTTQMAPQQIEERIFEIVGQFERGAELLTSANERTRVSELHLIAGKRAQFSMASASALKYFANGRDLLAPDSWAQQYALTFSLEYHRAECELITGALSAADERLKELSHRALDLADIVRVACLRMTLYTTMDRSDLAVEVCLQYLRNRNVHWSSHPTPDDVRQEYDRISRHIGTRSIEELIDLPSMQEPEARASIDVLSEAMAPALFTDKNLLSLVLCRMINLSLQHGNSDGSCVAYVWLGTILGPHFDDYRAGLRFGNLGYELVERRGLHRHQARTYTSFGNQLMTWTKDRERGRALTRRGFDVATRMGDFTYAAYSCSNLCANYFASGDPLPAVQLEVDKALNFARQSQFGLAIDIFISLLALIRSLRGLTSKLGSLDDGVFAESAYELHFRNDARLALPECWYWVRQLQARVYANDYVRAIEAGSNAQRLLWTSPSFFEVAEYHFFDAIARAQLYDTGSADDRRQHLRALYEHRRALDARADICYENFISRAVLVSAELARIEGRVLDAIRNYERAIQLAREHGFSQIESLALELTAHFYVTQGIETIGNVYLRYARNSYERWGASGKVAQLERLHPRLREAVALSPSIRTLGTPNTSFEVETVLKVSQTLSSEIELSQLIETLMRITVEHAGAARALLVLLHRGEPLIEAVAITDEGGVKVTHRPQAVSASELPETVLHYVLRTRESVILGDVPAAPNPFSEDVYLRQTRPRSIFCLPLLKQATLTGALYLENRLTPHVFTSARLGVLHLLASQAAISLENAQLYTDLRQENSVRQRAEDGLRRSEAYLAEAQRLSHTGSFGWNPASGETYWSEETFRILELDRAVMPSVELLALERVHPGDLPAFREIIRRASSDGRDFSCEHRLRMPDGRVKHLHVVAHAVSNDSGSVDFLGAVKDVTFEKWAQEERQRLEQRLRQAEKMEAMGRLASGIAHDFNNILAGVFAYGEMLHDEAPENSRLKRYAQNVLTAASHGRELIDQILTYSGSQRVELAPVNLVHVVDETLELLRGSLRADIDLDWCAPDFPIIVISDPTRLHRVVMNVCNNAIQSIAGKGTVRVALESAEFDSEKIFSLGTLVPGPYAKLIVQDTGAGMDEATLSHIFEPFFTTKPVGEGTGLGLSLVYAIVTESRGAIDVTTILQQGSAFSIYLPLPTPADIARCPTN